ncbi:MAG: aldehyde ferredoxin oxidoreductase family protein [Thaumarchaeota archaeon]|nr:aldehyde ferredoxin oxidoreductase family protein [Nitrososphaerota archaeon]
MSALRILISSRNSFLVMFSGYAGRVLHVDLTNSESWDTPLPSDYARQYLGGRGIGAKLLWDEVGPRVDPLGPQNRLIITTGPLTGTGISTSGKFVLTTKSPLTNMYMFGNAGGGFGVALKNSGFDAMIVSGRADVPVYILVDNGKVRIENAEPLWGRGTFETIELIRKSISSNVSSVQIGPAGEKLARIAAVITESKRAFGRCGAGAVMGSKNLKAIVGRAKPSMSLHDRAGFYEELKTINELLKVSPGVERFRSVGTQEGPALISQLGIYPTKNWTRGEFHAAERLSQPYLRENYETTVTGCPICTVRCTHVESVKTGPYASSSACPEYETLCSLGGNCMVDTPEPIIAIEMLCDDLGLDSISLGVALSFVMECCEKGLLKKSSFMDIQFGDHATMLKLTKMAAYREGPGAALSDGTKILSQEIGQGSERFAMHAKGLELGGYDPRGSKGQGLVFAIGNRGGCHHANGMAFAKELRAGNRFTCEGKGRMVSELASHRIIFDSIVLCAFVSDAISLKEIAKLLTYVTGINYDNDVLLQIGQRINTLERAFNVQEGIRKDLDTLPARLLEEPLPDGMAKGQVLKFEELESMKEEYYACLGWDPRTGIPTQECLERLGMTDVWRRLSQTVFQQCP